MANKSLIATAYHESGHAVAAWDLRYRVHSITIVPTDGSAGRTIWTTPLGRRPVERVLRRCPKPGEFDRVKHLIEHAIIVAKAWPTRSAQAQPALPLAQRRNGRQAR